MSNDRLLQTVVSILLMTGYNVSERCEIRPRSFDLMTSKGENLLVIKVVSQIDSVNEDIAWDLDKIARHLHAVPLIIGERARDVALERGAKIIRVHDVVQTMDALKLFQAVQAGWREH